MHLHRLWKPYTVFWKKHRRNWQLTWLREGLCLPEAVALLGGLEELIEEETGINTVVAEEPALAVAIGTGQYMELMSKMNGRL